MTNKTTRTNEDRCEKSMHGEHEWIKNEGQSVYYCKKCKNEYQRKWGKENPEKMRESGLKWKKNNKEHIRMYSLKIKEAIANRKKPEICEICGRGKRIEFDHDHKTGKFRGWICRKCNTILGFSEDNKEILFKIIKYLEQSK